MGNFFGYPSYQAYRAAFRAGLQARGIKHRATEEMAWDTGTNSEHAIEVQRGVPDGEDWLTWNPPPFFGFDSYAEFRKEYCATRRRNTHAPRKRQRGKRWKNGVLVSASISSSIPSSLPELA